MDGLWFIPGGSEQVRMKRERPVKERWLFSGEK